MLIANLCLQYNIVEYWFTHQSKLEHEQLENLKLAPVLDLLQDKSRQCLYYLPFKFIDRFPKSLCNNLLNVIVKLKAFLQLILTILVILLHLQGSSHFCPE